MSRNWYLALISTTLLFTITVTLYTYLAFKYSDGPHIEFITTFGTLFAVSSCLRKMSNGNGTKNGKNT